MNRSRMIVKIDGEIKDGQPFLETSNYIVMDSYVHTVFDKNGKVVCFCWDEETAKTILKTLKEKNG